MLWHQLFQKLWFNSLIYTSIITTYYTQLVYLIIIKLMMDFTIKFKILIVSLIKFL
jgi:hypothetical protein